MSQSDQQVVAMLTGAGAPFALADIVVAGVPMRGFVRAEASLASLFAGFALHADKPFIVEGERRLTYAQTGAAVSRIAATLAARGIGPGDRVAIAMRNGAEWMAGFLATLAVGAVPALVNSRGAAGEMMAAIALVDARLALVDASRAAMLDGAIECLAPLLDPSPGAPPLP